MLVLFILQSMFNAFDTRETNVSTAIQAIHVADRWLDDEFDLII